MVNDTRVGEMRTMTLTASLGLTLALGLCGTALAGDRAVLSDRRGGDAYVLTRGDHGSTSSTSLDELLEVRKKYSGEFLWARRGGKSVLIRDRAVLGQAHALFEPLRALDPERKVLNAREREIEKEEAVLEDEVEKLERQEEKLEDDHSESADTARENIRRQKDALRPPLQSLQSKDRDQQRAERALDDREEVLERKAEEALWKLIDATLARGGGERLDKR